MRAIDLYSGIGGWSLGLELNNIKVIRSYEWWDQAVETSNRNLLKKESVCDVRKMSFSDLKNKKIDIVVGSPPCTQFSYSNRGGSGDLEDGIIDLYQFFKCVKEIKPKFWAMENVPRVANVIAKECQKGGYLYEFKNIIDKGFVEVLNMREYGVPQKRRRCIASNVDLKLLKSYRDLTKEVNLGDVLNGLSQERVKDPNFKIVKHIEKLSEMEREEPLSSDEERMNREMKTNHPIYNKMSFPEDINQPARTITATCTRVSRESLIVRDKRKFRRLSIRERASIQGFPVNFEFHGSSHSNKVKMIGNAIPPKFTYFLAAAMREIKPENLILPEKVTVSLSNNLAKKTSPDSQSKKFPKNRSFKFAMQDLNFKSGTRFELNNSEKKFKCFFYYGDSKRIRELKLNKQMLNKIEVIVSDIDESLLKAIKKKLKILKKYDHNDLQIAWSVKPSTGTHPFEVVDLLNCIGNSIHELTCDIEDERLLESMVKIFREKDEVGLKKIADNYRKIFSGIIVCSYFNSIN
tara:strand:+ start:143 stop:1702 length:1560 start_codon:yes stop_codon:yes gene_type:complete